MDMLHVAFCIVMQDEVENQHFFLCHLSKIKKTT